MTNNYLPLCFIGLVASLFFYHCGSTSTVTKDQSELSFLSEDYYMQYQSLETRVAQLMCGKFSCYNYERNALFNVNTEGDSIIVHTVLVGDQNKVGTWVYKEAIMSSLPDRPLIQLFQKIEREAPDSLTLYEYRPKEKKNSYIGYHQKPRSERYLELEDLVSTGCTAGIKKITQTEFEGEVALCYRNRGDRESWINIKASYMPIGILVNSTNYSKSEAIPANQTSQSSLYYKRWAVLD